MTYEENELQEIVIRILTKSVTRKMGIGVNFETSDYEDLFFRELVKSTMAAKLNPNCFYFEPMSNKSFSVQYSRYPIGRIKISGKTSHIQVLKGLYGVKEFENLTIEEYISCIPDWIRRIKYCLK